MKKKGITPYRAGGILLIGGIMRKYLCLSADEHTPETDEIVVANAGICPVCGGQMVWEDD